MNAGAFGMPSGQVSQGRKLARQLRDASGISSLHVATGGQVGAAAVVTSTPIGVRSQVMNISGRGAARFLGAYNSNGTNTNLRLEIVVDGVPVYDATLGSSSNYGHIAVGNFVYSSVPIGQWDYVPFDSSFQVFLTSSAVANPTLLYVVDIHQ